MSRHALLFDFDRWDPNKTHERSALKKCMKSVENIVESVTISVSLIGIDRRLNPSVVTI
jgi:hypothetical protein